MKKSDICYGSMEEIRAHNARREGRPPTDLAVLNQAFEKIDPGGKIAERLMDKYSPGALCDLFLGSCFEGKLGEEASDIVKSIPELGPINLRNKVRRLVLLAIKFTMMSFEERRVLIKKGGWTKEVRENATQEERTEIRAK